MNKDFITGLESVEKSLLETARRLHGVIADLKPQVMEQPKKNDPKDAIMSWLDATGANAQVVLYGVRGYSTLRLTLATFLCGEPIRNSSAQLIVDRCVPEHILKAIKALPYGFRIDSISFRFGRTA